MTRLAHTAAVAILALACATAATVLTTPPRTTPAVTEIDTRGVPPGFLALPSRPDSVKFAVIGDSGRGWAPQHDVARQMAAYREQFPFAFVLMAGDNIYEGPATPDDYRVKFEEPYAALLAEGVKFYAVLGNHDDPDQRNYPPFHMAGHRYYTFTPPANAAGGSGDRRADLRTRHHQLRRRAAGVAGRPALTVDARWKVVVMHHPLYSSGRYSLQARLFRWQVESLLVDHGADVVFSGHEHIYQRSRLQRGIQYFITGGAGSLRRGDGRETPAIASSFDRDFHFMLIEIADDAMYFQAITRAGVTVDAGVLRQE